MDVDREFLKHEIDTLTSAQIQQVKAFIHALKIATPPLQQTSADARQILFDRLKATPASQPEDLSTNNLMQ